MREIEIKIRIDDKQRLLAALKNAGVVLSDPKTQYDQVFGTLDDNGLFSHSEPWLRLRTQTNDTETRIIFTYKKAVTGQLDSIEHETVIDDFEAMRQIILALGYVEYVAVKKIRQTGRIGDLELCLDDVEGLGTFLELEKLTSEDTDLAAVNEELWHTAATLGLSKADQVRDGYDVLKRQKAGQPI